MTETPNKQDLEKIIERIRKLFALGTSSNEHEAALAVEKAHELLAQYDLSMDTIENLKSDKRTSIKAGETSARVVDGTPEGWKRDLFEAVAQTSDCFATWTYCTGKTSKGKDRQEVHGAFIGFRHDVEMAGYAFSFLVAEIERLAQEYSNVLWGEIKEWRLDRNITQHQAESQYTAETGRHPLKAKIYFTRGAAETVRTLLFQDLQRRQDTAARANPHALVLAKRAAVQDFIYQGRYGMTKAEYDAKNKAAMMAYEAANPSVARRVKTEKEMRAEEAANRRWERGFYARQERESRATDHDALRAGREAGRRVSVRPGIPDGPKGGRQLP